MSSGAFRHMFFNPILNAPISPSGNMKSTMYRFKFLNQFFLKRDIPRRLKACRPPSKGESSVWCKQRHEFTLPETESQN
jgi:hypothetical protein